MISLILLACARRSSAIGVYSQLQLTFVAYPLNLSISTQPTSLPINRDSIEYQPVDNYELQAMRKGRRYQCRFITSLTEQRVKNDHPLCDSSDHGFSVDDCATDAVMKRTT